MHEPPIEKRVLFNVAKTFSLGICEINAESYNFYDFYPLLKQFSPSFSIYYLKIETHPPYRYTAGKKRTVTSRCIDMIPKLRYLTSMKEYPRAQIPFCFLIFFRLENHKSSNDRTDPSLESSSFLTLLSLVTFS